MLPDFALCVCPLAWIWVLHCCYNVFMLTELSSVSLPNNALTWNHSKMPWIWRQQVRSESSLGTPEPVDGSWEMANCWMKIAASILCQHSGQIQMFTDVETSGFQKRERAMQSAGWLGLKRKPIFYSYPRGGHVKRWSHLSTQFFTSFNFSTRSWKGEATRGWDHPSFWNPKRSGGSLQTWASLLCQSFWSPEIMIGWFHH